MSIRVGQGYDIHLLKSGNALIIGGVTIPYLQKLYAHSDGDVLLHAIIDALFGSIALGDIGSHFSDTDIRFSNINSRILLRKCASSLKLSGFSIINVDTTIIAKAPKLIKYIYEMRKNISEDLNLDVSCVSVKSKTNNGICCFGTGKAIAAQAIVLVNKN